MDDLVIQPTKKTPGIQLTRESMLFYGRAIGDEPKEFFKPIFEWVKVYLEDPPKVITLTIKLTYINAAYVQSLLLLFQELKEAEAMKKQVKVTWHYVYGDLEMLQLGSLIQSRLDMEFEYNELDQSSDITDAFSFA